jgi:hypothetical protein
VATVVEWVKAFAWCIMIAEVLIVVGAALYVQERGEAAPRWVKVVSGLFLIGYVFAPLLGLLIWVIYGIVEAFVTPGGIGNLIIPWWLPPLLWVVDNWPWSGMLLAPATPFWVLLWKELNRG